MNKRVLSTIIDDNATRFPENIAIDAPEGQYTYRQLTDYSNRIANDLISLHLKTGDVVGVYLSSSFKYVAAILGINKAGGIFMPLETEYPPVRLRELLARVKPVTIITTPALRDQLMRIPEPAEKTGLSYIVLEDDADLVLHQSSLPQLEGSESSYLIYTSGSTGIPKIIEGVHKSLSHFIHWEVSTFELGKEVRTAQFAPVSFDVSLRDIFVPLLAAGTIVIPDASVKKDPALFLDWLCDKKITLLHIVPSYFRELTTRIRLSGKPFKSSLKYILLAGEPLLGKDVQEWYKVAGKETELVNLYGPSETTLAKVYNRISRLPADPGDVIPLGLPINNTAVAIINDGQLCNIGEIGEIYIRTPFRSKGYWGDPELTARAFIQSPLHNDYEDIVYKTGDLGKYEADKNIVYVGRMDSQVKIRGNRVELSEVRQTITNFGGTSHVEIISIEQEDAGLAICCYYTCIENDIDHEALKIYLNEHLPSYMHPAYYVKLEMFPLNLNGKTDRKALPKPEDILYQQQAYEAPADQLEADIAQLWSTVLGINKVGVNNPFFQLGGHSLTATRIVAGIHQQLHRQINLKDFFENNTVRKLAQLVRSKDENQLKSIAKAEERDYYRATPAQQDMYLQQQLSDYSSVYNMSSAFRMSGHIDKKALQDTFNVLLKKHEILRTTFTDIQGQLHQRVHNDAGMEIENKVHLHQPFSSAIANAYIQHEIKRPFDLEKGPLWRVLLVHLAEEQYLLVFTIHHVICDGWSMKVLTKDFLSVYKALSNKKTIAQEELSIQYKDYTSWLWQHLENDQESGKQYWMKKLGTSLPELYLPLDLPRSAKRSYEGNTIGFSVGTELSAAIRRYCLKEDVSLFIFFESVIKLLLLKLSGQHDIITGTAVAGRVHPELENQVGLYLNYLALRTAIDVEHNFGAMIRQVKQDSYESFRYQLYPFNKLADDILGKNADPGRNPLYDVLFIMNNKELNAVEEDVNELQALLGLEWIPVFDSISKTDLTFFINDDIDITINTEYRTDLFHAGTIHRINEDLVKLIEAVLEDNESPVKHLIEQLTGTPEAEMLERNQQLLSEDF